MSDSTQHLWRLYEIHIDLYKHHTELLLKFMAYYYAVTGAILSFYISQGDSRYVLALLLPLFLSVFYGFMFLYASREVESQLDEMDELKAKLRLRTRDRELGLLRAALKVFGTLLLLTSIVLGLLLASGLLSSRRRNESRTPTTTTSGP